MHEKDDLAVSDTKFSTTNNQKPALDIETDNDTRNAGYEDTNKNSPPPLIIFKRTADMIGQHRTADGGGGGGTTPATTGDVPMSGTSVIGTAHQDPSLVKLGGETNAETLSKSGQQVTIPLRPARVHKAPRQSRQYSSKSALSEYTTHLMYMEAFNQKHLKDNS